MIKLRIRMELNRGGVGVPLRELARVVDEAQKFFSMLGDDVRIDRAAGEWLASDFDNEFLHFTAEFSHPVELHQIDQFRAAFDGMTQLRRGTIAQFARIGIALGENETIAFGLFRNDEDLEPDEWRSLSKRDAARINSEISELLTQTGETGADSLLSAPVDTHAVTKLFVGPREPSLLAGRVAHLENEIARQAEALVKIRATTTHTDQGLQGLMKAVDVFCERTTRHLAELPAPAPQRSHNLGWRIPAILLFTCIAVAYWWLLSGSTDKPMLSESRVRAAEPTVVSSVPAHPAPPTPPNRTPPNRASRRIDLKAIEPDWITVYLDGKELTSKLLNPLESITIDQPGAVRIRSGNAGGAGDPARRQVDRPHRAQGSGGDDRV